MASADIIILSSSPPKQFRNFDMPSSPSFPSPNEIIQKKATLLRTGSRAASIPQNASSSFTTAASLFRKASFDGTIGLDKIQSGEGHELVPSSTNAAKAKQRMPSPKENELNEDNGATKTSRKTIVREDLALDATGEKKPRKPRVKKIEVDDDGNIIQKPPPKPRAKKAVEFDEVGNFKARQPPKPRAKKPVVQYDEDGSVREKAAPKPRAKKAEENGGVTATKEKSVRKPRAKKTDGEIQTTIPKGRVTKSSMSKVEKNDFALPTNTESISRHFSTATDTFEDPLQHGLAPAPRRRTNWTPPPPTLNNSLIDPASPNGPLDVENTHGGLISTEEGNKGFTDLLGSFGFNNAPNATIKKLTDDAGTRKRKLVELVKANAIANSKATPPQKEKAVKKKARTITGLATSAYAPEEDQAEEPAPILQYFEYQTTERVTSDGFKVPPKPRSKSSVKKSMKGTAQAPILLSPESALKQVTKQDFIFGTSSQLAREESPGFLRDIHAAMQASNEMDYDDPFANTIFDDPTSFSSIAKGKSKAPAKHSLWSAAARDVSGELLDIEMVDLVDSPAIAKQTDKTEDALPLVKYEEESWADIDETPIKPQPTSRFQPKPIGPVEAAIRDELLSSPLGSPKCSGPSPKLSQKSKKPETPTKAANAAPKPSPQRINALIAGMPDFTGYTTAQLEKQIARYHFKPVKSRDKMITLLESCWEGEQKLKALKASAPVNASRKKHSEPTKENLVPPSSQFGAAPPKRPRGRPRKDGAENSPPKPKSKNTVEYLEQDSNTPLSQIRTPKKSQKTTRQPSEDISDSDTPKTPSPPRRHPTQIQTTPLPLQTSSSTLVEDMPELSPKASEVRLFKYITRAVTKVPPSKDPREPTWHEKILLYDPIILEDLTVWLNTGALEKVGWDDEVEPKEVKRWCECKSICCLWKENLRGGARSRY